MNVALYNVIMLSLAFFCCSTAYLTVFNIQKYVIEVLKQEDPTYNVNAYIGFVITYVNFAVIQWIAPTVVHVLGVRVTFYICGIFNIVYIAQFLRPTVVMFYIGNAVSGLAGGIIWAAQGNFLTRNSTQETIGRNASILVICIQSGSIVGNTFALIAVKNKTYDEESRKWLFGYTTAMICLAAIVLFTLRKAVYNLEPPLTLKERLLRSFHLIWQKDMLLLSMTFIYYGLQLSFFGGVYTSSLGFIRKFQSAYITRMMSASGILISCGHVIGGILSGVLAKKIIIWGRYKIVILGCVVHVLTLITIGLNFPNSSIHGPTRETAIFSSNIIVALICSFLLGFADACVLTQIYATLGTVFASEGATAFAIFRFLQSVASSAAFLYTPIGLYGVLSILIIFSIIGTITFTVVELKPTYIPDLQPEDNMTENNKS